MAGLGAGSREAGDSVAGGRFKSALFSAGRQVKPLTEIMLKKKVIHKKQWSLEVGRVCVRWVHSLVRSFCHGVDGSEGAGPKCRHGFSQKSKL